MVAVLLVVTSWDQLGSTGTKTGWYLPEVAHPYHVLKRNNCSVTFCSPKGGHAPMDPGSYDNFKDEPICAEFLADKDANMQLQNTVPVNKVDPKEFQVIFFAGGHGPMWDFPDNKELQTITAFIYEHGGIVSGVCHGVVGCINVKLSNGEYLVKDKEVTCFTNSEETAVQLMDAVPFPLETKLVEQGAIFKGQQDWQSNVVVSERLITGQNPASATPVTEAIIKKLKELNM